MRSLILTHFGVAVMTAAAACGAASGTTAGAMSSPSDSTPINAARADSVRHSYSSADVEFMTGMIHHHAQALVMARMAPTHGASASLQVLAGRIINSQNDEISLMEGWLRDRNEAVPEPSAAGMDMKTHSVHSMRMPGMLTDEQLEELDAARGPEFDRLFVTYMIQHHQGAVTMVNQLFNTYGAGQGDAIFKLASDISADQASEIARMQEMLRQMMFGSVDSP